MKVSILASVIWLLYTILVRVHVILSPFGRYIAHISCAVMFLVTPIVNHVRMLIAIRRHNRHLSDAVASQQMSAVLQREKKVALDMWIVTIVLFASLTPVCFMKILELRYPLVHSTAVPWFFTLVLLTSSINPLFYFWRNKNLRNTVKSMIRI